MCILQNIYEQGRIESYKLEFSRYTYFTPYTVCISTTYQNEKHIVSDCPPATVGLIIFTRFCLKMGCENKYYTIKNKAHGNWYQTNHNWPIFGSGYYLEPLLNMSKYAYPTGAPKVLSGRFDGLRLSVAIRHSKSPVDVFLQLHESLSSVHSALTKFA